MLFGVIFGYFHRGVANAYYGCGQVSTYFFGNIGLFMSSLSGVTYTNLL